MNCGGWRRSCCCAGQWAECSCCCALCLSESQRFEQHRSAPRLCRSPLFKFRRTWGAEPAQIRSQPIDFRRTWGAVADHALCWLRRYTKGDPTMGAEPQETHIHMNEVIQSLLEITEPTTLTESSSLPSLDEVEKIIGYKFKNKDLLEEAFTHSSYMCSFSYERLEYVGDSVLQILFSREHYLLYRDLAPGKLTRLRAANVDTEKLARVALRHGFHRYLRHKKRLLEDQIHEFARAVVDYPLHSNGLIDAPKDLADLVESIIGAIFMDCNSIDTVWEVFKGLLEPVITPETIQVHFNTQLHEMCQKNNLTLKYVDSWEKEKTVDCFIDGQFVGRGTYRNRKEVAQNRAAKDALDNRLEWMVFCEKDTAEEQEEGTPTSQLSEEESEVHQQS